MLLLLLDAAQVKEGIKKALAAGWLAGLDPGSERMWSGDGSWEFPGPYSQESRLP